MTLTKRLAAFVYLLPLLLLCACASAENVPDGYDLYFQESNLNAAAGGGASNRAYISDRWRRPAGIGGDADVRAVEGTPG